MKKLFLLTLLTLPCFAQDLSLAPEDNAPVGKPSRDWVLLNSKGKPVPQGRKCRCNKDGRLVGYKCSKKYVCEHTVKR